MKKKIFILILMIISINLIGCVDKLSNTPKRQVEIFLNKYQTLDTEVLEDLNGIIEKEDFTTTQQEKYRDIVKKNYQKLTYKIKDETIDGDDAIVKVEIEVVDYTKANNEAEIYLSNNPDEFEDENGEYNHNKFIDYRLEKLKDVKETVKYTLELNLTKNNDKWQLDELTSNELAKINGTYSY